MRISTARRRQVGAYGALLAVSILAACDKDQPTSPTPKPATANALRGGIGQIPPATIKWTVVDENNANCEVS
jgi:hypothetical protein